MTQETTTHLEESPTRRSVRKALESSQLDDFMAYVRSPWRIIWSNFLAGVFRGLGMALGATAVLALLIWMLTLLIRLPIVGEYAAELKEQIVYYAEEAQYGDDFQRLEEVLKNIEEELSSEPSKP